MATACKWLRAERGGLYEIILAGIWRLRGLYLLVNLLLIIFWINQLTVWLIKFQTMVQKA